MATYQNTEHHWRGSPDWKFDLIVNIKRILIKSVLIERTDALASRAPRSSYLPKVQQLEMQCIDFTTEYFTRSFRPSLQGISGEDMQFQGTFCAGLRNAGLPPALLYWYTFGLFSLATIILLPQNILVATMLGSKLLWLYLALRQQREKLGNGKHHGL